MRLLWVWGEGQRAGLHPVTHHLSLLQPEEEEIQTVFDMEPSSTSSTPTSLVSPESQGQVGRAVLAGVVYSSGIVGDASICCPLWVRGRR